MSWGDLNWTSQKFACNSAKLKKISNGMTWGTCQFHIPKVMIFPRSSKKYVIK